MYGYFHFWTVFEIWLFQPGCPLSHSLIAYSAPYPLTFPCFPVFTTTGPAVIPP